MGADTDALGLKKVNLHLGFGELETHTIDVVQEELAKALGSANVGRMKIEFVPGETDWMPMANWQLHHLGGTRMGTNPKTSVVDPDCKLHSVHNLYIASSSTFPTGGCANPTMNIIALVLRLAATLKKEFIVS